MNRNIQSDVVRIILNTHIDRNRMPQRQKVAEPVTASHGEEVRKPVVKRNKVDEMNFARAAAARNIKNVAELMNKF